MWGQEGGLSSVFALRLKELSGHVQGLALEFELIFESEGSEELWQAL